MAISVLKKMVDVMVTMLVRTSLSTLVVSANDVEVRLSVKKMVSMTVKVRERDFVNMVPTNVVKVVVVRSHTKVVSKEVQDEVKTVLMVIV